MADFTTANLCRKCGAEKKKRSGYRQDGSERYSCGICHYAADVKLHNRKRRTPPGEKYPCPKCGELTKIGGQGEARCNSITCRKSRSKTGNIRIPGVPWQCKGCSGIRFAGDISCKNCNRIRLHSDGRMKEYRHNRRARLMGAEGRCTRQEWTAIVKQQDGRCNICKQIPEKLTMDHIVPLIRGGSNWPSNIQGLCRNCNSRKHTKLMSELTLGEVA